MNKVRYSGKAIVVHVLTSVPIAAHLVAACGVATPDLQYIGPVRLSIRFRGAAHFLNIAPTRHNCLPETAERLVVE